MPTTIRDLQERATQISNRSLNSASTGRDSSEDVIADALFDFEVLQKLILEKVGRKTLQLWADDLHKDIKTSPQYMVINDILS